MRKLWLLAMIAVCAGSVRAASAPTDSFRIGGAVAKSETWTVPRLSQEFKANLQTVHYTAKGVEHTAQCIGLLNVIQFAQPKVDTKKKNHQIAFVAVVQGRDGYTASFSMGELLPDFGKREVWLALDEDGKPLSEKDGPVRLVVPSDEKPARWVHEVQSISLVDGAKNVKK